MLTEEKINVLINKIEGIEDKKLQKLLLERLLDIVELFTDVKVFRPEEIKKQR